ncbi:MAG: prolyl oligopeptidase family serine peptidase, partial [Bacteroidota bacterium]
MKSILLTFALFLIVSVCVAQKKPLDHTVYDGWQHIGERMISNDGKWIVYTIDPQEGDNELVIQSSDAKYKKTVPRGYTALITEDSRFLVFKIKPFYKDTREAKIKKKKADDMPKDSMAIIELGKEQVWKTAKVRTYKTPQRSFGWVAYHLEKVVEPPVRSNRPTESGTNKKITDSLNRIIDSLQNIIQAIPERKRRTRDNDESDTYDETSDSRLLTPDSFQDADGDEPGATGTDAGTDLVIRKLETGEEKTFANVLEYYFSKTGDQLLIEQAKNPKDSLSKAMIVLYDLKKARSTVLSSGGNDFKNFAMTDDGSQFAWLAERDARPKELQKFYRVWYYKQGMDSASLLADKNSVDMHLGMGISEFGNLSFSKNGKRLFFGTAPVQSPRDTSLVDFEHPKLDIWHYNDDYLQTVQNFPARLRAAQQENFLAVYDLDKKTIRQLGSKEIPQVLSVNEGDADIFVGVTDYGKRVESQWTGNTKKDIYAIDVSTGMKKLVKADLQGQVYPSPSGKYIMWYDRKAKNYFSWDGTTTRNITEKIKAPLWNEENDSPDDPNNYGVMKWLENDEAVLLYDRYGAWKVDPKANNAPVNFVGDRDKKIRYRYVQTDPDEKFIKKGQGVAFLTLNEINKRAGLWQASYNNENSVNGRLIPIHADDTYSISQIVKSKNTDYYIFSLESFTESPDLYYWHQTVKGPDGNKLSSINPQQKDYNWGTAELFKWKAYNGKDATGLVYKPEDFDPKKKYPMIVYFYEKLSDGLYDYKEPAPIRSAINVPFFVSRGYIIFMPDIEFKIGYPGKSAYDYIVSGARALVKKGWVDSTNMAMQGHSWGGYQAAQVATMTKIFKTVWAGAPVANMTSAYGGIRWESGVSRQFQYEKTQSRIGGTLWQKLPLYLENSPLFHLDKVTSPMVIMSNDADGAVPWYQGIELFSALRRLGKKVWLFNYNGQGHGLTQRQDMRDYQIRMQQ